MAKPDNETNDHDHGGDDDDGVDDGGDGGGESKILLIHQVRASLSGYPGSVQWAETCQMMMVTQYKWSSA